MRTRRYPTANRTCDYDYFRRIEGDEFLFTDARGNVISKQEDLAGEKDCKPNDNKHEIDDARVLLYGDVAVLNARSTISGVRSGSQFRIQTRFTDVFVWRKGGWQIVAGHSSRIPEKR